MVAAIAIYAAVGFWLVPRILHGKAESFASELSATADLSFVEEGAEFVLDADAALVVARRQVAHTAA